MKKIQLGHHVKWKKYKYPVMYTLVDDKDYGELSAFKWYARKNGNTFYAARSLKVVGKQTTVLMHAQIMKTPKVMVTDHIVPGNGLNNQRSNLRVCTQSQNLMNQGSQLNNTSGFKGVTWHKGAKKWQAQIRVNKKHINLGLFPTKELAYEAYVEACEKYHGAFANY